ncbi:MAG: nitroreductase [Planctomycetota bacterium]
MDTSQREGQAAGVIYESKEQTPLASLLTRRSPRLSDRHEPAPDDRQLETILTAASRVPDHGRLVPWRFIVIRGDRRDALNCVIRERFEEEHPEAGEERRNKMAARMSHAPLVVVVVFTPRDHPKIPEWEQVLTVGSVCMNLLHACRSTGFAGLWLTEWYAYDRPVLAELGLSENEQLAGFMHIGTPTDPREDRERPRLVDIVTSY